MMLVGLLYGLTVHDSPYPQLTLGVHEQLMVNGMIGTILGMLLHLKISKVEDASWKQAVIHFALVHTQWLMVVSEMMGAHLGCNKFLKINAARAGATGCSNFMEGFVAMAHIGPALSLIAATTIILLGTRQKSETEKTD
jgi:uncharacterized membrane protein